MYARLHDDEWWAREIADSYENALPASIAMDLDDDGRPHIAYHGAGDVLEYAVLE